MMKNNGKRTLREDAAMIWRGVKIFNEMIPGYWGWCALKVLAETFSPYFGLFMSAKIINEIAGACDLNKLLTLAAITVLGGFAISMITRCIQGRCGIMESLLWQRQQGFIFDAQNRLQYEHIENPDVVLLRSQIFADSNATGGGLMRLFWNLPNILRYIFSIIFSVSLTASMFTLSAQGEFSGFFGFINSPYSALVLIVLVFVSAYVCSKFAVTQEARVLEAISGLATCNNRWQFYNAYGPDMSVFNLHRVVMKDYEKHMLRPEWLEKQQKITIKFTVLDKIFGTAISAMLYLFVAAKAFIKTFGIGEFTLYVGTVSNFIHAVTGLSSTVNALRFNNVYLERLYKYLDLPNNMYMGSLAVEKRDDIDYQIEFRNVSFKYPRTDVWTLKNVNIKFRIGDKLAIVGENGSGKTTFIKLLCRLYDPTEGKILLNGIDITRYRYDEYMALFSVVFQDYTLFDFPLGEIVSAGLDYDESKVRSCLIRAGLDEKLKDLDADEKKRPALQRAIGYEYINEGMNLSGGEKQKVALARALYKDAPFVVLDEPTAALDPIAEAAVYENFNNIASDKTSVFISHRLSSCRFCDRIAVFDHGELKQMGGHDELMASDGKYRQLWFAQAQYYDEGSEERKLYM